MKAVALMFAAMMASAPGASAAPEVRLTVRVEHARSDAGRMLVAVYDSSVGFPGGGHPARTAFAAIHERSAQAQFDLPPGVYAVAVVHDENANAKLDTGFLGIPREGIGASNDAQGRFGPARFGDAKLSLSRDTTIDVRLVYAGF